MRTAKDGKPFDIDGMGDLGEHEIEIIQFLRPDGKRRRMAAPVGKEYVEKAKDMIISAEELTIGEIAIYVRREDEPKVNEIMELAENGPGDNEPTKVLQRLIDKRVKGGKNDRHCESIR